MKVLVTGGAGYIGTELTYALSAHPKVKKIIIYDNLSRPNYNLFIGKQKFTDSKVQFIHGDILDSRKVKQILNGVDVVYHLAAKVTTPFSDQNPHLFEQVNHWGTAELVYAVEESTVSKLIYISSASVYGAGNEEKTIQSPLNPKTYYGMSKMRGEKHVQRVMEKMPAYIFRCGNVYGYSKSMRFDAVINKFMFDANFTGRITVQGDGSQHRAFIHIAKTVSFLASLIDAELTPDIYNLTDKNLSVNEIVFHLKEVYPELEMLYVNQHFELREIKVLQDERISGIMDTNQKDFTHELQEFRDNFTFHISSMNSKISIR